MAETCENCYALTDWLDDDGLCEWCELDDDDEEEED